MRFCIGKKGYEMSQDGSAVHEKVTNWLFTPQKKIIDVFFNQISISGILMIFYKNDVAETHEMTININWFNSLTQMKSLHPEASTILSGKELQLFKKYFVELCRDEAQIDVIKTIHICGIVKDYNEKIYVGPGHVSHDFHYQDTGVVKTELMNIKPRVFNYLEYLQSLRETHHQYIVDQILFWCAGVMAKGFCCAGQIKAPILFSYGKNNTGKTALHKKIIGNFFSMGELADYKFNGYFNPSMINLSGQTSATLQRHSVASNLVPMMCDEFKYEKDDRLRVVMSDFLRSAYDQSTVHKAISGTDNLRALVTERPISITGESSFKAEGAIKDRSLLVYHRPFSAKHSEAFTKVDWGKLVDIGNITMRALLKAQDIIWELGPFSATPGISTRNVDTMNFMWNGAKLLNDIFSTDKVVYTRYSITESINTYKDHINIDKATEIDDFFFCLQDMFDSGYASSMMKKVKSFTMVKANRFFIALKPFYKWLLSHRFSVKKQDISSLLKPAGFLGWKNSNMHGFKPYDDIAEFDIERLKKAVKVSDFPTLFADLSEINRVESVQEKVKEFNYEDL